MTCSRGYLPGLRCRFSLFASDSASATVIHKSHNFLSHWKPERFHSSHIGLRLEREAVIFVDCVAYVKTSHLCVDNREVCMLRLCQIVANGGGSQMQLHAAGVPSYFQYSPLAAGCVRQPAAQPHIIHPGGGTVPQLCNGAVKFVLQPTATIPVAPPPPPPLCITSLVLTPVSGFQGQSPSNSCY